MKTPEQKALELVRTIARMHRYDFDELRNDEIEDVLETANGLICRAREIVADLDHSPPQNSAPQAELAGAIVEILKANDEFRAGMPDGWEGDPLQDACEAARKLEAVREALW